MPLDRSVVHQTESPTNKTQHRACVAMRDDIRIVIDAAAYLRDAYVVPNGVVVKCAIACITRESGNTNRSTAGRNNAESLAEAGGL